MLMCSHLLDPLLAPRPLGYHLIEWKKYHRCNCFVPVYLVLDFCVSYLRTPCSCRFHTTQVLGKESKGIACLRSRQTAGSRRTPQLPCFGERRAGTCAVAPGRARYLLSTGVDRARRFHLLLSQRRRSSRRSKMNVALRACRIASPSLTRPICSTSALLSGHNKVQRTPL